jgi:hypothetical protein
MEQSGTPIADYGHMSPEPRLRLQLLTVAVLLLAGTWPAPPGAVTVPVRAEQEAGRSRPTTTATLGAIETALSTTVRPAPNRKELDSFLPSGRGTFRFPPPYNTTGYRLTQPSDCGGKDCVNSVGYSYWRNMNNSAGAPTVLAILTLNRDRGGSGPTLFEINKETGAVTNRGALFTSGDARSGATGEGWYFSATLPTTIYIPEPTRLTRYDVKTHASATVFDVGDTDVFGSNRGIWQVQSSNDDTVHSFSVTDRRDDSRLGCGVYNEGTRQFAFFPRVRSADDFDECQIDKSGRWLLIKEQVDGRAGEDNRIIDLATGAETLLIDEDGAGGHSDMGFGMMVAADNWYPPASAWRLWTFGTRPLGPKTVVYRDVNWDSGSVQHVSWENARPGDAENQIVCGSRVTRDHGPRSGEVICFQLDGSLRTVAIAPVMTDLDAAGGGGDEYTKLPKGNLDPTGEYFIWTSNMDGSRLDAFVVKVPVESIIRRRAAPRE